MSQKPTRQSENVMREGFPYTNEENSGFKSALLIKPITHSVDHHGKDFLEGLENANICSDSFNSEKKKSSDTKLSEMNFKNCLSSDLLQRLEENSPIKSNRTFKSDRVEMNYMTNYTDRNEDELEDGEESPVNVKYSNKDSHSLFYCKNSLENEMGKFYLFKQEQEVEQDGCQINLLPESLYTMMVSESQDAPGEPVMGNPPSSSFYSSNNGNKIDMEKKFQEPVSDFSYGCFNNYFNSDREENLQRNIEQMNNKTLQMQNFYSQTFGQPFANEQKSNLCYKSPDYKRFYDLDGDIAFYPKNYNRDGFNTSATSNNTRHRELNDKNNFNDKQNQINSPFYDSSFSNSVNNLFKNKINLLENNFSEEPKFNSLLYPEEPRNASINLNKNFLKDNASIPTKVTPVNDNHKSKSPLFTSNSSKKQNNMHRQNLLNPNQIKNQNFNLTATGTPNSLKENNSTKPEQTHQSHNSKSYLQGKSGWVCNNCKNFNYESKFYELNNLIIKLARIKCNRCGRPQIKNQVFEEETNQNIIYNANKANSSNTTNSSNLDKNVSSSSSSTTNKQTINNNSSNQDNSSNQIIYNKNPKFANTNNKQSHQLMKDTHHKKSHNAVPASLLYETTSEVYDSPKDLKDVKDSPSPDISTKANSIDSKKKKKPFIERVGDWVCIKCKNLNFSFRVVCNRCQLSKEESENLFDQYMKNLMNYVKLNEILQNQIFNNSNFNNLLEFNGLNNQLMSNLNKNMQHKKIEIPYDPNLLNYLKIKCLNSNGFSPNTNFSTEGSNSNLGINQNYYTDSLGDKLGNKSK
jgi:hypothetical protein